MKYFFKKLYCECLNESLTNEKYFPVKDYLYKIVKHYNKDPLLHNHNHQDYVSDDNINDFMKGLFYVFNLVMEENKYDDLDKYINLLFYLHTPWYEFNNSLRAIIFKDEHFRKKEYYYHYFNYLTSIDKLYRINDGGFKLNTRIAQVLSIHGKYHKIVKKECVRINNSLLLNYYDKYASLIVANFYKTDLDIDILDKSLEKFAIKLPEIYVKYTLNGISDQEYLNSSLGFDGENEFSKYLLNNEINSQGRVIE